MAQVSIPNLGSYRNETLSPAIYTVEVVKAEDIVSQQKGTRGLALELMVVDGPDQPNGSQPMGKRIFDTLWYPHSGMKDGGTFAGVRLQDALACFGVLANGSTFDVDDFVGKQGTVKTQIDESGDQPREKVAKFIVR